MRKTRTDVGYILSMLNEKAIPKELKTLATIAGKILVSVDEFYAKPQKTSPNLTEIKTAIVQWVENNSDFIVVEKKAFRDLEANFYSITNKEDKEELQLLRAERWFINMNRDKIDLALVASKVKEYVLRFGQTDFIIAIADEFGWVIENEGIDKTMKLSEKLAKLIAENSKLVEQFNS